MKILIIGQVWPEPQSSAAGSRMMQLIDCFTDAGYKVHFACSATPGERAANLKEMGIITHDIKLNSDDFNTFAKALNPQVVVYDRFMVEEQYGWRIAESCPDCLRILDTEDLHGLRSGRTVALKNNQDFTNDFLHNDVMKRELASIYRCDLSLIISEFEMQLLQETLRVPEGLLFYLPFLLKNTSKTLKTGWRNYENTQDFMSIGNFKHWPNYDALLYLKNEIWPLIRLQLPDAKLRVYGAYSSQKITQLHNVKQGFLIEGFIENAQKATSDARVSLATLRVGAGLKGKIIEAMQCGTPCVTTPVGAEGMHGQQKFNGTISNNAKKFAAAAIRLYSQKKDWEEARERGLTLLKNRFNENLWKPSFLIKTEKLHQNLESHRLKNFTGAMLWHQSLQASRYMSKWIAAKNNT